jgi:membrane fusion protein (multidrug efflux system)
MFEVPDPTVTRTVVEIMAPTMIWTRADLAAPPLALGEAAISQEPRFARGSGTELAQEPGPALAPAPAIAPGPAPVFAEGSAPASLGLTPLIEREVFQLARRIALQADLPAAMRVLHHGLSRLTGSPEAMCVFFDPALCSTWAMPDGNAPRALDDGVQQLVAQVAGSGRRAVLGHTLVEPVGPSPTLAVLMIRRPPAGAAYGSLEIATVAAIATAVVGLVGHFVADHGARREQALREDRAPFRPGALAERRGQAAAPGRLVTTPRTWIRWAYPTLIGLVVALIVAAALIEVPMYSTGVSIITVEGEQVTSPMPGTVAEVLVTPGAHVAIGDPVLRLRALDEAAELAATETDYRNALATFLTTPGDDGARTALAAIATRRQRAKAVVDARTLRAPAAGIVGDIRVRRGQPVTPGAQVMKISPSTHPSVVALLPGFDRPRLEVGMTLQIELPGYHKKREAAVIDAIGSQVIGPEEARKSLGDPIGDALPITGPVVIVRAHLTTRTFEAGGREYAFHDGMLGKAEVKVDHVSLLRVLLPGNGA